MDKKSNNPKCEEYFRYLLTEYECCLRKKRSPSTNEWQNLYFSESANDMDELTIEHICPQDDTTCFSTFRNSDKKYIFSLGNLTLLTKRTNSGVQECNFHPKLKNYLKQRQYQISIVFANQFKNCKEWNKDGDLLTLLLLNISLSYNNYIDNSSQAVAQLFDHKICKNPLDDIKEYRCSP